MRKFIFMGVTGIVLLGLSGLALYYYPAAKQMDSEVQPSVAVTVYFNNDRLSQHSGLCDVVFPVVRNTPQKESLALIALKQLLQGPTPEEQKNGFRSFFSSVTTEMLNDVVERDDAVHIDFKDMRQALSGATSSCGQAEMMTQLTKTLRPFYPDEAFVFSIEGNIELFYDWLELEKPRY